MSAPGGRRVRGVLFDMDGVLLDTARLSMTLLPDVIRQLGYESPAGMLDRIRDTQLVWMLRALTLLLALDSGRRALALALGSTG